MASPPDHTDALMGEPTRPDPPAPVSLLLVDDDMDYGLVLQRLLRHTGMPHSVQVAYTVDEIGARPWFGTPDVALVAQSVHDPEHRDLIAELKARWPQLPIIMMTAHGDGRQAVDAMRRGAYDYVYKADLDARRLAVVLNNALAHTRLQQNLATAEARLQSWATRDELTGLYNRRHYRGRLEEEIVRAQRHAQPLTVLLADLDHFKELNDTYGHPLGDEALRVVSQVLQAESRSIDIVSRYGGEEFAVLLPNTSGRDGESVAERIRRAVAASDIAWAGDHARLTISVGIATLADSAHPTVDGLMQVVDRALYSAKRAGRDRVHRAGRATGPLASVAQGSEIRRRLVDGFVAMMRAIDPTADARAHRAVTLADRLAAGFELDAEALETLLTAARLGPLTDHLSELARTDDNPLAAGLGATGVLGREAQLVRRSQQPFDAQAPMPPAARLLAVARAASAWADPSAAAEALRPLAGSRYDPQVIEALAALTEAQEAP